MGTLPHPLSNSNDDDMHLIGPLNSSFRRNIFALSSAIIITAFCAGLFFSKQFDRILESNTHNMAHTIASQTASTATELIISNNLVSLNVMAKQVALNPQIQGISITTIDNKPLANAGQLSIQNQQQTLIQVPIIFEDSNTIGYLSLLTDSSALHQEIEQLYFRYLMLITCLLLIAIFSLRIALHRERKNNTTKHEDTLPTHHNTPHKNNSTSLRIGITEHHKTANTFTQQTFQQLLNHYNSLLHQACRIYNGEVQQLIGDQAMIYFTEINEQEAQLHALCCSLLFKGLADRSNQQRKSAGKPCLHFQIAVYNDKQMTTTMLESASWELCDAATNGAVLLAATDSLLTTTKGSLLPDNSPISRIHIGQTALNAYPVFQLSPSYQHLINNQTEQLLSEPTQAIN